MNTILINHISAVFEPQIIFPEVGDFQKIGQCIFLCIRCVPGAVKTHENIDRRIGRVGFLAPVGQGLIFCAVFMEHAAALQTLWTDPDFGKNAAAVQLCPGIFSRLGDVVQKRLVVRVGQADLIGRVHRPPGRLVIIIQMIITVPIGPVCGDPVAKEPGRKFAALAAAGHQIMGCVPECLDFRFAGNGNAGGIPESLPPVKMLPAVILQQFG